MSPRNNQLKPSSSMVRAKDPADAKFCVTCLNLLGPLGRTDPELGTLRMQLDLYLSLVAAMLLDMDTSC